MNELILIRGLPGTGKSTYAKEFNGQHIEADMYFMDGSEYKFDSSKLSLAHKWCLDTTERGLKEGHTAIVSNTFTKIWEMKPYLDLAEYLNIPVTVYRMTKGYGSIHNVPQSSIDKMSNRFEYYQGEILK
jgi:predicted kinase